MKETCVQGEFGHTTWIHSEVPVNVIYEFHCQISLKGM